MRACVISKESSSESKLAAASVLLGGYLLDKRIAFRNQITDVLKRHEVMTAMQKHGIMGAMTAQAKLQFLDVNALLFAFDNWPPGDVVVLVNFFLDTKNLAMQSEYSLATLLEPQQALFSVSASKQAAVEVSWNRAQRDNVETTVEKLNKDIAAVVEAVKADDVPIRMQQLHSLLAEIGGQAQLIEEAWPLSSGPLRPPTASEQPPVASEQPPTASEQPPVASEQPPTASEQPPTASEQPPTASEQPPVASEQPEASKTEGTKAKSPKPAAEPAAAVKADGPSGEVLSTSEEA